MAQNNKAFLVQTREKMIELDKKASKDNKILIIPMAITEIECKELLLDYLLSENIDIKHYILVSGVETIKGRIMNNEDRDKNFSLTFLKANNTFLDENYKDAIRINTDQKTPEEVANEIYINIVDDII